MSTPTSTILNPLPTVEEVAAQISAARAEAPKSAGNEAVQAALDSQANADRAEARVEAESAPAPVEAAPEEKSEEAPAPKEEKKDPLSSKFAAVARREREARAREKAMEERLKAMETRDAELKAREERLSNVKKSPLRTLKELGISLQDITSDAIGEYKEPEVDPVTQKLSAFEERLKKIDEVEEKLNSRMADLAAKEQQAALREVTEEIKRVAADEKYEYIQSVGEEAVDLVKEVMSEYWRSHQRLLDYAEACDIVEQYYEDSYVEKFLNTKKVKSRFTSSAPAAKQTASKPATKEVKETATLTQSLSAANQAMPDIDKMSKEEAIALLSKQLKFIST